MADYSPEVVREMDVRNFTTPPLAYADVSKAELDIKIETVETWAKWKYFKGGSLPSTSKIPITLIIVSNLLSNPTLAKKHYTLASESLGDYSYSLGLSSSSGKGGKVSPLNDVKTWSSLAEDILSEISSTKIKIRKAND